jgi:hypothetical protein
VSAGGHAAGLLGSVATAASTYTALAGALHAAALGSISEGEGVKMS